MLIGLSNDSERVPSLLMTKASKSAEPGRTSEPSKYIDQAPVPMSYSSTSSSAKVTPPTEPEVVELR